VAYPARNPRTGEIETRYREVKGPVVFLITTTNIEIDEEVENRCIVVTINESREQTRLIHQLQRYKRSWEGLGMRERGIEIQRLHQNAQRLLKPYSVFNPYSEKLTFLDNKLRN
jgi:PHP family Zn ribbon phosphoesterase